MVKYLVVQFICACAAVSAFAQAGLDEVLGQISQAAPEVVFLGEVHDNPTHHQNQHQIAMALAPKAVVFEMINADQAADVARAFASGGGNGLREMLDWDNSGWPDFGFYAPLLGMGSFAAIYGAGVDRAGAREAFDLGAAQAFGGDAARFGLDQPLPSGEQTTREAEQLAAHCGALTSDILPAFVEAQRLRDAVLAQTILQALEEVGGPVVVITGNGHARRDIGAPRLLSYAAPALSVFSLGQTEAGAVPDPALYDAWISAPAPRRDDPCEVFR